MVEKRIKVPLTKENYNFYNSLSEKKKIVWLRIFDFLLEQEREYSQSMQNQIYEEVEKRLKMEEKK